MTTELLESLLQLARAESKEPQPTQLTDLREMLAEASDHFAPALQASHHALSVSFASAGQIQLRVSASHLRAVLIAILDNAVKYTPSYGRIDVHCVYDRALHLRIADTGVGIAEEHLHRIFDRFFRVETARTSMREGVGLGLAIAKQLMEKYGGSRRVESRIAVGTSVTLTFPEALTVVS